MRFAIPRHGWRRLVVAAPLVLALSGCDGGAAPEVAPPPFRIEALSGQAAPAFVLHDLEGRRVALADLRGRPAFLYFWAAW